MPATQGFLVDMISLRGGYFRQCAAIKSNFQATAATNLKRIMTEYRGIK